jgi:hypothetical protein
MQGSGICARKCAICLILLGGLAVIAGCNGGKIKRYPVHGVVNVDGRAADGVRVIFCPTSGSEEAQKLRPTGVTNEEGKFTLTTIDKNDGAPAGDYKVIAQWLGNTKDKFGRPSLGGEDKLQGRYMKMEKSELTATVNGATDLPPFELKSK